MSGAPTSEALEGQLRSRFGLASFRPGQREAIEALFAERGLLCIQPTGHGKSLLYQLPATLLSGTTLVISPLLALMRDQVSQLGARFGIEAGAINSDQSDEENDRARLGARDGSLSILFVAPEQLERIERFDFLVGLDLSLVVVDEAHCISTWGHDFRPAYREIARLVAAARAAHPDLMVLGLTATADERAELDIRAQLAPDPARPLAVHRREMDRPNLALGVTRGRGAADKLARVARLVDELEGPGLIYCATRDRTEIVAEYLTERGLEVPAYHAGKDPERKRALQRDFLGGAYSAIAATNALGMGIDKSDLRYVIHFDVPGSITAYYQEVGRAGRDGQPARGVLIYDEGDRAIQEHFIHSARPTLSDFEAIRGLVERAEDDPPRLVDLKRASGLHPTRVIVVAAELIEQRIIAKEKRGSRQVYVPGEHRGAAELTRYERQHAVRTRELDRMIAYGRGEPECAMRALRLALGDDEASACGRCSACTGEAPLAPGAPGAEEIERARAWLARRPVVVSSSRRPPMAEGRAAFDSNLRDPAFLAFMRARTDPGASIEPETIERLITAARAAIGPGARPDVLIVAPSTRWAQRASVAALLAEALGIPLALDALRWERAPEARQGELLNNDQRRANVARRMQCAPSEWGPATRALLLDDYTGSGATLREAVRAIQSAGVAKTKGGGVTPICVASVRWRLGRPGIV